MLNPNHADAIKPHAAQHDHQQALHHEHAHDPQHHHFHQQSAFPGMVHLPPLQQFDHETAVGMHPAASVGVSPHHQGFLDMHHLHHGHMNLAAGGYPMSGFQGGIPPKSLHLKQHEEAAEADEEGDVDVAEEDDDADTVRSDSAGNNAGSYGVGMTVDRSDASSAHPNNIEIRPPLFPGSSPHPAPVRRRGIRASNHVPRPKNSFMLYRQDTQPRVLAEHRQSNMNSNSKDVSGLLAEMWRRESEEVRDHYRRRAELLREEHKRRYPDFKYSSWKADAKRAQMESNAAAKSR
ncbi:hypothetical protein HK101_004642, partial [Irineochytrium annulatum]